MTHGESEQAGDQPHLVRHLDSLSDSNWRVRQVAVDWLVKQGTSSTISQVAAILRNQHRDLSRLNAAIQVLVRTEGDVIPALLPSLVDPDPDTRAYVALTLGLRGDPRAIPELITALSDSNTNVRVHAIEAIGKLRAASAVDRLIQLVEAMEFEFTLPALDALTAIGDERIAGRLVPLLREPLYQTAAVEALGRLGDEESVIALCSLIGGSAVPLPTIARSIQQIHDRHAERYGHGGTIVEIIQQAPLSISELRSAMSMASPVEQAAIVAIMGWLPGTEADATLLDLLDTPEMCQYSLAALADRGPEIVPALLKRLQRPPAPGQLRLLELCGRIADRSTVSTLLKFLRSEDEEAIAGSLAALARIGDLQMYEETKRFLEHPNSNIRQAAVSAVNSLGHPNTAGDMQQLLQAPSALARESALKIAAYFGFTESVEDLLACCDSPDERIRRTAIEHLPCLDDDRVAGKLDQALASSSAAIRSTAACAIGEIEPSQGVPLLCRALNDSDVWVRYYALRSLAKRPHDAKLQATLRSLATDDPAMQVRIAAVEAMSSESVPLLVELSQSDDEDLATAALAAIGRTGHVDAIPALITVLRSAAQRKAIEAIRALGQLQLLDAIPPLLRAATGQDPLLAEEAIVAMGRMPFAESTSALIEVMKFPFRRQAAIAAVIQQGEAATPVLAQRLQDLPLDVRLAVVAALIGIRSEGADEQLEFALADEEPAVRQAALSALAHVRRSHRQSPDRLGSEGDA